MCLDVIFKKFSSSKANILGMVYGSPWNRVPRCIVPSKQYTVKNVNYVKSIKIPFNGFLLVSFSLASIFNGIANVVFFLFVFRLLWVCNKNLLYFFYSWWWRANNALNDVDSFCRVSCKSLNETVLFSLDLLESCVAVIMVTYCIACQVVVTQFSRNLL